MVELVYKEEVFEIIGAAIEVHRELGHGYLEAVCRVAIEIELERRHVPQQSYKRLRIQYKEGVLQKKYVADYLCWGKILVDLKALDRLTGKNQILNYLKGTKLKVGLIINFGSVGRLDGKRFVR